MIDLLDTYRRLSHPWTHEQLAARFSDSQRRGARHIDSANDGITQRIPLLATAMPPSGMAGVAIHMVHALPDPIQDELGVQLLETAERNTANALNRCQRALELDGHAHGYTATEWHPVLWDIAGGLLASSRLDDEPPGAIRHAQDATSWLARTIIELHEDSVEAPTALVETLARLLAMWTFTATTLRDSESA